ncbi:TetR family transcriptional regulator [Flaviflexus huanghaiensis]|uniref:TetR family transcriptional regulator n=1 Tax=Flaviflexus huanghaiensis TaxID=1111473 RepID=UPI0015F7CF5F
MFEPQTESVKEKNRRAIIAAAGELATSRGIGNFTAAELADRAGVSRRSIFNHFPSTADAVHAYLTARIDPILGHLAALNLGSVDDLIHSAVEILQGDEAFAIISHIGEVLSRDQQKSDTVLWASDLVDQVACQLGEVIGHAMDIDPIDIHFVSNAIISAVQTAHAIWLSRDDPSRARWNSLVARALELIRTGHRSLDR